MKNFVIIALAIGLVGCSSRDSTIETLTEQGYTNIETHGHAWFACSKDDTFATKFTATSPSGHKVKGAVCKGWFKGATIRFDTMDLHTIIMGLWIGSAVFYWTVIIFAIALVVLSIYILVKDWDGAMAMFEQWYGKVKSRWSK